MRQVFYFIVILAALMYPSLTACASDWVEDNPIPNRANSTKVLLPKTLSGHATVLEPFSCPKPFITSVAPHVFHDWLVKSHASFAAVLSQREPQAVVQVKGIWDNSDATLRAFGIPHQTIKAKELTDLSLNHTKVLVVNCPGNVPAATYQKVRDFVASGGYLLSTDWTLSNLVSRAFPGYLEWNGAKTSKLMVDAQVIDQDPGLFAGIVSQAWWKMDEGSEVCTVMKPSVVRVLVASRILSEVDPDRRGVLAAYFQFGRGAVLHLVGHFDNNSALAFTNLLSDPAPGMGISLRQGLAANFVLAGLNH